MAAVACVMAAVVVALVQHVQASGVDLATYPPDLRAKALSVLTTLTDAPAGFGPPCSDRAAWSALVAANSSTGRSLISRATSATLPPFDDDAYLAYVRTGSRASDTMVTSRIAYIGLLALAECVQWQGNFLSRLNEGLVQVATQRSWAWSAHDTSLTYYNGTAYFVELSSSAYAAELAQVLYALGPAIPDATRSTVLQALETRVFRPMRAAYNGTRGAMWWLRPPYNNWNAVCLGGLTPAALSVLQDKNDRALFVAGDLLHSQFFTTFTADGYDTEGVSYFVFAVSNAIRSRQIMLQHTKAGSDSFNDTAVAKALLYALEFPMSSSSPPCVRCVDANANFGDDDSTFSAALVVYIQNVFLGSTYKIGGTIISGISGQTLTWSLNAGGTSRLSIPGLQSQGMKALRKYYAVPGILIARPDNLNSGRGIALTAKTLGNSYSHSHNDIGSYVISLNGSTLTGDPGKPGQYDANSFNAQRYTQPIFNSYGHPVPRVCWQNQTDAAAQAQRPGAVLPSVISTSFSDAADTLVMNLTAAYNVSSLQLLQRSFTYVRSPVQYVVVRDSVALSAPGAFETALVTLGNWTATVPGRGCFQKAPNQGQLCAHVTSSQPFTITSELLVAANKKFTRIALRLDAFVTSAWIQVLFFDAANPPVEAK